MERSETHSTPGKKKICGGCIKTINNKTFNKF